MKAFLAFVLIAAVTLMLPATAQAAKPEVGGTLNGIHEAAGAWLSNDHDGVIEYNEVVEVDVSITGVNRKSHQYLANVKCYQGGELIFARTVGESSTYNGGGLGNDAIWTLILRDQGGPSTDIHRGFPWGPWVSTQPADCDLIFVVNDWGPKGYERTLLGSLSFPVVPAS